MFRDHRKYLKSMLFKNSPLGQKVVKNLLKVACSAHYVVRKCVQTFNGPLKLGETEKL